MKRWSSGPFRLNDRTWINTAAAKKANADWLGRWSLLYIHAEKQRRKRGGGKPPTAEVLNNQPSLDQGSAANQPTIIPEQYGVRNTERAYVVIYFEEPITMISLGGGSKRDCCNVLIVRYHIAHNLFGLLIPSLPLYFIYLA